MSSQDDRETVVKCLHLGAADYLVKPLRHNELRNLWTRVWWRRVVHTFNPSESQLQSGPVTNPIPELREHGYPSPPATSSASEETKCDEEEPTSKEGSAPVGEGSGGKGSGHGSGGGGGSGGNETSRVPGPVARACEEEEGNGNNSASKNGHGNSATKYGGSNGNGASTTHAAEAYGGALKGTAQGGTRGEGHHARAAKVVLDTSTQLMHSGGGSAGGLNGAGGGKLPVRVTLSSKRSHSDHLSLERREGGKLSAEVPMAREVIRKHSASIGDRSARGGDSRDRFTMGCGTSGARETGSEDTQLPTRGSIGTTVHERPGYSGGGWAGKSTGGGGKFMSPSVGGGGSGERPPPPQPVWPPHPGSHPHSHPHPHHPSGMPPSYPPPFPNPIDMMRSAGAFNPYAMFAHHAAHAAAQEAMPTGAHPAWGMRGYGDGSAVPRHTVSGPSPPSLSLSLSLSLSIV
jgi:hypothetical protein